MTKRIVLVGNGTNTNRGCEAIARGTLKIFKEITGGEVNMTSGVIVHTDEAAQIARNVSGEGQPSQFAIRPRLNTSLGIRIRSKLFNSRRPFTFEKVVEKVRGAGLVLEVGGDNYSLDYGKPYAFIDLDNAVRATGVPLAIWGASIGPFSDDVGFETEMKKHLSSLEHVFVRETVSFEYLKSLGLSNITLMADPAILMPPQVPENPSWDINTFKGAIGLNMSPFQARQLGKNGHAYWETDPSELSALADFGSELVRWILQKDERPVLLIPHVMAEEVWNNDHVLLCDIYRRLNAKMKERVTVLPDTLNAPQLKWALGQCSVFAGSRTHSTLGAISSGVPTLAFGYSRKAKGLMRDLYGHDEMCLQGELFDFQSVTSSLQRLIDNETPLRTAIAGVMPLWRERALNAGRILSAKMKLEDEVVC